MSLALEYIGKLVIILAVVAVVIGFMYNYYSRIQDEGIFTPNDIPPETEAPKNGTFDAAAVAGEIKTCWLKTGPDFRKDFVCTILLGTFSITDSSEIKANLPQSMQDRVIYNADYTKSALVIEFVEAAARIRIRN